MRYLFASFLLTLSSCAWLQPKAAEQQKQAEAAVAATDECLEHPELAKKWGECNVKSTIFSRKDGIEACRKKFLKQPMPGSALVMRIRVQRSGQVRDVTADTSAMPQNIALERCLSKEISLLRFAPPPKGVKPVIFFPYQLN
jgi:hypothetical protein